MFCCGVGDVEDADTEVLTGGRALEAPAVEASGYVGYEEGDPPPDLPAFDSNVVLCDRGCGRPVPPGEYRPGRRYKTCCRSCALNPGIGFHDRSCGGKCADTGRQRPACKQGSRCRQKTNEAHLAEEAHPLDQDYAAACGVSRIEPESLSVKTLFDWADTDGSGRLAREELLAAYAVIKNICKDGMPDLSDEAWKHLDEDGNGVLNFMEFASWAGPRLGLPLGINRLRGDRNADAGHAPCTVLGCPCEHVEEQDGTCKACKHKCELHRAKNQEHAEVPFPDYWQHSDGSFKEIISLNDASVAEFQQLLDQTHRNKWTRDRSRHNPARPQVPKGFKVVAAHRNENAPSWVEYGCRRAEVLHRLTEDGHEGSVVTYTDVKSMVAYRDIAGSKADRLAHDVNEWYLFHGTSPENARKIMKDDFRVSLAGSNTGTLYGRGLYFAESVTKADEYAKPNADGVYAVLLCRVIGGIVNYNDEVTPDPEALVQSCISGRYSCVLGDREKCRGTFREFVLFDSEDVYPEYLIEYRRDYG